MDLSPSESFTALYYALSYEEGQESGRCAANMVDTLLFHNGQPYRWLFTSEKTGLIMKRSGAQWNIDDIKHMFKKRFIALRGKRTGEYRSKFAVIWYVDAPQKMTYRVVDEEELDYLLQNRFFTQYIAAVQLYFGGYPLKGSGWFEHRVYTDDNGKEFHQTTELILPTPQPEFLDLNKFISDVNSVINHGFDFGESRKDVADEPRKLYITESQHDYLKPVASKLLHYLRAYTHCRVVDATFMFGFNSTWAPFVVGVRSVHLRDVPQSVQLMRTTMFSSFDSMFTLDMQIQATVVKVKRDTSPTPAAGQPAALKTSPQQHIHKTPHIKSLSRFDSVDVIPSFTQENANEVPASEEFTGDPTDPENIPKPNLALLKSGGTMGQGNVDYSKREEIPVSMSGARITSSLPSRNAPISGSGAATNAGMSSGPASPRLAQKPDPRAVGAGGNPILNQKITGDAADSILHDYALAYGIGFRTDQTGLAEKREQRKKIAQANVMKEFSSERARGTIATAAVASREHEKYGGETKKDPHRYAQITDAWSRRVKVYPSQVRGSQDETWDEFRRTLRPLSPAISPGQAMLARSMSGPIPTGFHGKLKNTRKATGIERRNTMTRGTHCHGDFCALAPQLVKATQERQRQLEREEEETRLRMQRQAEEERQKAEQAAKANKGGKGHINFSMLAAIAMKEREKEKEDTAQNDTVAPVSAVNPTPVETPFDRKSRTKQAIKTPATHDIPCKSVMMSRVEEDFTGFNYLDLVHQYTQMGFALEDILSECARMSLNAVADKCRTEAFRSACTQKNTPDFDSLNAMEAAHRKLVYSRALSSVHPSKFYQTVPVCETCFQLYSCLDALRETIVFLRADTNTNSDIKTVLPAGVTESVSHNKSDTNSSRENEYYKNLQKSLRSYSRDCSDSAHSAEQQLLSSRLATPKHKSAKFERQRPQSAVGNSSSSTRDPNSRPHQQTSTNFPFENDADYSSFRRPLSQGRQRPQTAGSMRKDHMIEGQLSDRRTSKLPYNSQRKQPDMHKPPGSKFVAQKRSLPAFQLGTVEDVSEHSSIVQNDSSYFAGEVDEDSELHKSSYLLLAKAVPRIHSQSGPTLGTHAISFAGGTLPRTHHNVADPERDIQKKNFENIKIAENVEKMSANNKLIVTDQNGTEHSYNNIHYVHSL